MNKQFYMNEPSLDAQSTTVNNATRNQHTILVKPCFEGKSFPCYESGFDATIECPRVIRLEDMREGIEEHTAEELYDLKGKQPLFYLQEMFNDNHQWQWNGYLLYTVNDKERARKIVADHADELNVILAFDDPDIDRYSFLIKTPSAGSGTEMLTEENFLRTRSEMDWELKQYFHYTIHHDLNFYVRALTEDHYDIIDRDALFGQPVKVEEPVSVKTTVECEVRTCKPESVGDIIKSIFGRIFKTA